jgi:hypothetical protein
MFGSEEFLAVAKQSVLEMAIEGLDPTDHVEVTLKDIYVTWFAYTLGNMKALLSTSLPDGRYYEVTYNKETKEIYVDCYGKLRQKIVTVNLD